MQNVGAAAPNSMQQYTGIARSISYYTILLLSFLLPFFFVPVAWVSIVQAKVFLIALAAILATVALIANALSEGKIRIPKSPLLIATALVPLAYLFSAIASGASQTSFFGGASQQDTVVAVFLWYTLFVTSTLVLSKGESRLLSAFKWFMYGGAVTLIIQVVHIFFPSFTFGGVLVGSTASVVGGWHDLGIFLGLLLFLSLVAVRSGIFEGKFYYLPHAISFLSLLLLVAVNFRDVWIGVALLSTVYGIYLWKIGRESEDQSYKKYVWWFVLALLACVFAFYGSLVTTRLPGQLQITQVEVRPSWQGTFSVGTRALAEPGTFIFGSGPNSFTKAWGQYKPVDVNSTDFWNTDFYSGVGFIPTSIVTVGLLGAIAWGAAILALLWGIFQILRRRMHSSRLDLLLPVVAAGSLYLTLFHILYVPQIGLSALVFLFFGFLTAGEALAGRVGEAELSLNLNTAKEYAVLGVAFVFGILVLIGGVQTLRLFASDSLVNRAAYLYNTTGDIDNATRSIQTALTAFSSNDRAHRAAVELGLLQLRTLGAAEQSEEVAAQLQKTLTATIQHGLSAVSIESANYQNWLSLARLYAELAGVGIGGADAHAKNAYEEARIANPTNPTPHVGLALLALQENNDATAKTHLEEALKLKPNLAIAYFLLSQIYARAGDLENAAGTAQSVAILAPQDPLAWYHFGTIIFAGNDYENAALAFERAVGLENNYANALYFLSASYAALGRLDDARIALQAVVALNPNEESLQTMLEAFEAGENPFGNSPVEDEGEQTEE